MKIRNLKLAAFVAAIVVTVSCALAQDTLGVPEGGATAPKSGNDQKAGETAKPPASPTPDPAAEAKKAELEKKLSYARKIKAFKDCPKKDWDWAVAQINSIEPQLAQINKRLTQAEQGLKTLRGIVLNKKTGVKAIAKIVFDKDRGVKALDKAVFDKDTGLEARVGALEKQLNKPDAEESAAKDDSSSKEAKQPDAKEADKPAEKADQQGAPAPTSDSGQLQVVGVSGQETQPDIWWGAPPYWGYIISAAAFLVIVAVIGYMLGWLWNKPKGGGPTKPDPEP